MGKLFKLCGEVESLEQAEKLEGYHIERKYDGTRNLFFFKKGVLVKILNRRGLENLNKYPQLLSLKLNEEFDYVFDGEICYFDEIGVSRLNLSQRKINWKSCVAVLFDVLVYENVDVRNQTLKQRLELLSNVKLNEYYFLVKHYLSIREGWEEVKKKGLEGLILKNLGSKYNNFRNSDWVKLKNWKFRTVRFNDFEVHNKGITLTNGFDRVACNGKQSVKVAELLVSNDFVDVNVRFLEETINGFLRKPTFHGIKKSC
jgi:ATP-dependent DNA ligase